MSASKTAEAAAKAVAKSNKKDATERTVVQIIADARNHAAAGLHITNADVLIILGQMDSFRTTMVQTANSLYDATESIQDQQRQIGELQQTNTALNETVAQLKEQNAQFRNVYELENRSASVKIQKVDEAGDMKVETVVGSNSTVGSETLVAGVAGVLNASSSGE